MTMQLERLNHYVTNLCRECFPLSSCEAQFEPILDLGLGDVGSDIFQRIAAETREAPEKVAEAVLPRLQGSSFGRFSVADNFLNLAVNDDVLLAAPLAEYRGAGQGAIAVVPHRRGVDLLGFMRVVACAALQWSLGGRKAELISAAGVVPPEAGWRILSEWLVETASRPALDKELSPIERKAFAQNLPREPLHLWLYPDFIPRPRFRDFLAELRERTYGEFQIQCLDRDRIGRITERFTVETLKSLSSYQVASLVLYLARTLPGGELEVNVIFHQERANLRWSVRELMERLQRWAPLSKGVTGISNLAALTATERECLVRIRCLSLFHRAAVTLGRGPEFLSALEQTIACLTRYLNEPAIRLDLDRQQVKGVIQVIIASAIQSLSDIINSCLLFQDLEQAQP